MKPGQMRRPPTLVRCTSHARPPPTTRSMAQTAPLTQMELASALKAEAWNAWVNADNVNQELPWPNSLGINVCNRKAPTGTATRTHRMSHTIHAPA